MQGKYQEIQGQSKDIMGIPTMFLFFPCISSYTQVTQQSTWRLFLGFLARIFGIRPERGRDGRTRRTGRTDWPDGTGGRYTVLQDDWDGEIQCYNTTVETYDKKSYDKKSRLSIFDLWTPQLSNFDLKSDSSSKTVSHIAGPKIRSVQTLAPKNAIYYRMSPPLFFCGTPL